MFNQIDRINLFDGLNVNPIPLEFSQEMTTTKFLAALQAKVDELVLIRNEVMNDANSYTDDRVNVIINQVNNLISQLNNGDIIPDGSIDLVKLSKGFTDQFTNKIEDIVREVASFVSFGINDDGYFYANIPQNWDNINFDTNQEGNLILQY